MNKLIALIAFLVFAAFLAILAIEVPTPDLIFFIVLTIALVAVDFVISTKGPRS